MENQEERLFDLISSKSFSELTLEEKDFVMQELQTSEAYHQLREAHVASTEALQDDVAPPTDLKGAVMAAFDEKESNNRGIIWWRYAALLAGVALGIYFFWPEGDSGQESLIAENAQRLDSIKNSREVEETEEISPEIKSESEKETPEPMAKVLIEKEVEVIPEAEQTEDLADAPQIAQIETTEDFELIAEEAVFEEDEVTASVEMDDKSYPEEEITEDISTDDVYSIAESPAPEFQSLRRAQSEGAESMTETKTAPSTTFNLDKKRFDGRNRFITLKEIGGIDKDGYVAY